MLQGQETQGWIGSWSPGIGDPTPIGWLTVAAYFVAAALCWRARRAAALEREARGPRRLWLLLALLFVLLGISKQLDLQSAITELGRILARQQGWYQQRGAVQLAFVLTVAAIGAAVLGASLWLSRRSLGRMREALVGTTLVVAFVLIRASSIHRIDLFLGARIGGIKWNWILELSGIAVTAHGAWRYARSVAPPAS